MLTYLITGGTGSLGKHLVKRLLKDGLFDRLIVFSRDELKQHEMREAGLTHSGLRYFIGDVRDLARLKKAMVGVDYVIHAAAMKQVPACEYNPFEAVQTNILGAKNVIDAAIYCDVKKVIALSTDKAVEPVNLYGATKLVAEKLFMKGRVYAGAEGPLFSCVRYGNVVGSRGSVIPLFQKQKETGTLTITDLEMTRFWITLDQAVDFVLARLSDMRGGEVFVPQIPSIGILELADAIAPDCHKEIIGIRPGEKLHEILISNNEAHRTYAMPGYYFILSAEDELYAPVPHGFRLTSDTNSEWLTKADLISLIDT